MYRKNVASQYLYFALVNASTGAALTGATVTAKRTIDGGAQGSATGTVSEPGNGQYQLALSQADINGNNIGFLFTATSAVPVSISVTTTAADPTDSVRFGLTALPNAPMAVKKNQALSSFPFPMFDLNGFPRTGLTVTAQRSIDGAAFGDCTNTPATEMTGGWYKINLSAADLNGTTIALKFTATGVQDTDYTIVTQA